MSNYRRGRLPGASLSPVMGVQMSNYRRGRRPGASPSPAEEQEEERQYRYQSKDGKIQSDSMDGAYADLTRADWDNFEQNDLPYIMEYANEITDDSYIDRAVNQAGTNVQKGYSLANAREDSRLKGLGVNLSQAQINDRKKDSDRAMKASLVDAQNSARDSAIDRQNNLISGTNFSSVGG